MEKFQQELYKIILVEDISKSFQACIQLYLVLKGIKPGDWLEYTIPHSKWVISKIEKLIELGAPLAFLEPQEVSRIKELEFEDFSEVKDIKKILNHDYPHFGLKYHNTNISRQIIEDAKQYCSTGISKESPEEIINGTIALGRYFGYPDCCIIAFLDDTSINPQPYTEHKWCILDCAESLKLQELYRQTIHELFPEIRLKASFILDNKNGL